jgi:hypothetical protein
MKGGTTTLYHDLSKHPDLCLPEPKEPEILVRHEDAEAARAAYAAHFRIASEGQICGEASTAYTKRPLHEGVAAKAKRVCGAELKIIYMRRDPVSRALSQYKHEKQQGLIAEPFDEAVRRHGRFIDFSRYDWQIAPWAEAFGRERLLQLDLESYSADRVATLARVLDFIGVDPARIGDIDPESVSNSAAEQKHIPNPVLRTLVYSDLYQHVIKPRLPRSFRERARRSILPPAEKAEIEVQPATARFIMDQLDRGHPEAVSAGAGMPAEL